jgi:hypothetical protein
MWLCARFPACDSYVRCHEGSQQAMGTLAGPRLRKLRGLAHEAVDPLWQEGGRVVDRGMFYRIAGEVMGIADLHIGNLDEEGCLLLIHRVPVIEEALNRHAALVLHPKDTAELDADTRGLLQVLFEPSEVHPASARIPVGCLIRYGLPVQDLLLQGVLSIDLAEGAEPIASLSALGAQLVWPDVLEAGRSCHLTPSPPNTLQLEI